MTLPQQFNCPGIDAITPGDFESAAIALCAVPPLSLESSWRHTPDPAFRPGWVRCGHHANTLWVWAQLEDTEIFNNATANNQRIWTLGDTFEVFLRPLPHEVYWELHFSPNNHTLQLRFPSQAAFTSNVSMGGTIDRFLSTAPIMQNWTHVDAAAQCWSVLAAIDLTLLNDDDTVKTGDEWLALFGRYDYSHGTRGGNPTPVTSASAAMPKCNFHLHKYYQRLRFTES